MIALATTPISPAALPEPVPAVLDFEASGFGRSSYPIEIGYVLADGRTFCSLIRPAPGWTHWDPAAAQVHGLTREMLLAHGRDVSDLARHLNNELRGLTLYCDGWAHDYTWLGSLFEAADSSPAFKLDNLRSLLSEPQAARWHVVKQEVAADMQLQRHRASADARLLQRALMQSREPATEPG